MHPYFFVSGSCKTPVYIVAVGTCVLILVVPQRGKHRTEELEAAIKRQTKQDNSLGYIVVTISKAAVPKV